MYTKVLKKFSKQAVVREEPYHREEDLSGIVVTDKRLRKKMMKRAKRALKRINKR